MGEQRYKVGDWVRVKDNRGAPRDYKVGEVCQVTKIEDDIVRCGEAGMFDYRFEPWQPSVGERVRYSGKSEAYSEKELVGLEGVVTEAGDRMAIVDWDKAIVDGVRTGGAKYIANLEPSHSTTAPEQPAAIKIEEGKFYKTRDGRKVGPAFIGGNIATFGSTDNYVSAVWSDDGRASSRFDKTSLKDNDIIAEWIDEPVARASTTTASNDNAQPKFKVGDRVDVTGNRPYLISKIGQSGIVEIVHGVGEYTVKLDNSGSFSFIDAELTLAATPTTATIVALIENGKPKPSSTPHVHASTGAAEKEAKRLAAKFKGKQFGVFTLSTTHEEAAPVYDHKWQNLAVLGLKIDAIKELRSITGMGLKPAKDAVEYFVDAA